MYLGATASEIGPVLRNRALAITSSKSGSKIPTPAYFKVHQYVSCMSFDGLPKLKGIAYSANADPTRRLRDGSTEDIHW